MKLPRPSRAGSRWIPPAFLAAVLVGLLTAACGSSGVRVIPDTRSVHDQLAPPVLQRLAEARALLAADRSLEALALVQPSADVDPASIVYPHFRQDVELAAARAFAGPLPGLDAALPDESPEARVRRKYLARLEQPAPTQVDLVLAARLVEDSATAEQYLERAAAAGPACAWIEYARAFLDVRRAAWTDAQGHVAAALKIDPGHMRARWLECWMLARASKTDEAVTSYETWIERARGDVRVDPALVLEARLDLALLRVLSGDLGKARALLAEVEAAGGTNARHRMIEASAHEADGDEQSALDAAQLAEKLAPGELLPVVQQALLHELWLGDPVAAEAAWMRVLALCKNSPELISILERVRARVHLERLERTREAAAERAREGAAAQARP